MQFIKLSQKIIGWFNLVTAVVFLAASFFLYRHTHNFVQTARHTHGTVT
jgi:hypothetical protein